MPDQIEQDNLVIHAWVFVEDDPELILNVINRVNDLDLPSEFDSQIVNISEDNPEESALVFSDGLPQHPVITRGSVELLAVSVDEEDDISISVDVSPQHYELARELFNTILPLSDIHISTFDLDYTISADFEDLIFSISGNDELDYEGVKFAKDNDSYIIQSTSVGSWGREEETQGGGGTPEKEDSESVHEVTSASVAIVEHLDVAEADDFINDRIQDVEATLASLIP